MLLRNVDVVRTLSPLTRSNQCRCRHNLMFMIAGPMKRGEACLYIPKKKSGAACRVWCLGFRICGLGSSMQEVTWTVDVFSF